MQVISLIYISLPWIFFICGWLKWFVAVPLVSLFSLALFFACDGQQFLSGHFVWHKFLDKIKQLHKPPFKTIFFIALITLLWSMQSGAGGFGLQTFDWEKHNGMLKDLIQCHWPVSYQINGQTVQLVYYIAYYLPAAIIGKIVGWQIANYFLFAYTVFGIMLALLWFRKLTKITSPLILLAFVLFGGLGFLGHLILKDELWRMGECMEWWSTWQYSSNESILIFAPQHGLPAWVITSLVFDTVNTRSTKNILFYLALSALWSPFITLGLIPFCCLSYKHDKKDFLSLQNILAAPLLLILMALYYATHITTGIPNGLPNWNIASIEKLFLFYWIEFGLYSLWSCKEFFKYNKYYLSWAVLCLIVFTLAPLYKLGIGNDFTMRIVMPAQFIFQILLAKTWIASKNNVFKIGLVLLLLLGAIPSSSHIYRLYHDYLIKMPEINKSKRIDQLPYYFRIQYMGQFDDTIFSSIAKSAHSLQ